MIYLVGVSHPVQLYKESERLKVIDFMNFLKNKVNSLSISFLAEELNEEQLIDHCDSTALIVSNEIKEKKIGHRFCDPNNVRRKELGIPTRNEIEQQLNICFAIASKEEEEKIKIEERKYFRVRELEWIRNLNDIITNNIIFICGIDHLETFPVLLNENKINFEILKEQWHRKELSMS